MRYLAKFWDDPFCPGPVAIDFLTAESFSEAIEKATARADVLRQKYDDRIGYSIEDETGRTVMVGPGKRLAQASTSLRREAT